MKSSLSFSVGKKKTPFQRHKELEEERKRKADEEAAKLYEEFVESFKAEEDTPGPKAFVRGGTYQPGQKPPSDAGPRKPGGRYVPSFIPPSFADPPKEKPRPQEEEESVFQIPSIRKDKGQPRAIDNLLETIKKEQDAREERQRLRREGKASLFDLPPSDEPGSFDDGDPFTTNLYVGNLAPNVDEEILKKEFGRFGPIASVKVMWPRDDDQRKRGRNCGFVAFMRRDDAQAALDKLNGIMLFDYEMKIGWGKAVPIPPVPLYPPPSSSTQFPTKGSVVPPPGVANRAPWANPHSDTPSVHTGVGPDIEVKPPEDGRIRYIIDTLATYVMKDGCAFEQIIMETEQKNPEYAFLFDLASPEHAYYRWRLYSLAESDSLKAWRIEPFVMVEGGQRWIPPPMTMSDSSKMTAAQKGGEGKERERQLSDLERDKFEDMLRQISVERADICAAMVFALDNADAAGEVVEVISDSLTLAETPVPLKIARLFLVSDILHNSTAPVRNASRYRTKLEAVLPDIFESLQDAYRNVDSRMTQEALRRHVLRVLRVWRERYLFSDDYLNGLQATFLRPAPVVGSDTAQVSEELSVLADEEVERRCRMNGLAVKGGRDSQLLRLQALDVYLHGDKSPGDSLRVFSWPVPPPASTGPLKVSAVDEQLGLFADQPGSGAATPEMTDLHPALASISAIPDGPTAATPLSPTAAQPQPTPEPPKPQSMPLSRWTTVDEDEEKQQMPGVPISKWLLLEQQAQREKELQEAQRILEQQQAAAAAAAAAQAAASSGDDIFSDEDMEIEEPAGTDRGRGSGVGESAADKGEPTGAGGAQIMDKDEEERRQKLRKVELEVMLFREDLEEGGGLSKEEIDSKVSIRRSQLMAELESSLGRASSAPSRSGREGRDRDRDRDRDKDRDKDRGGQSDSRRKDSDSKDNKDRSRDKDKSRTRDRDRDREKDRDKEREKEREREREKDRERERDRDRDRDRKSRDKDRDKDRDSHRRDHSRDRDPSKKRSRSSPRSSSPGTKRDRSRSRSPKRGKSARDKRSRSRSRSPRGDNRHSDRRDRDRKSSRR